MLQEENTEMQELYNIMDIASGRGKVRAFILGI